MNRCDDSPRDDAVPRERRLCDDLARLVPSQPSRDLRGRVAAALAEPLPAPVASTPSSSPSSGRWRWLAERLAWAGGGAVAATLLAGIARSPATEAVVPIAVASAPSERVVAAGAPASERPDPEALVEHAPPAEAAVASAPVAGTAFPAAAALEPIAEESLAWTDEGVRFIDGQVPARVFRHWVLERYPVSADGGNLVLPREDVFVVPVSLR